MSHSLQDLRIALFGSGKGTSIEYVLSNETFNPLVSHVVVTNTLGVKDTILSLKHESTKLVEVDSEIFISGGRSQFESQFENFWGEDNNKPHVIFLLGWNYIMSRSMLEYFSQNRVLVINLHPALPGSYVGGDAVNQLYHDLENGNLSNNQVGSMVHLVTDELDRGTVLQTSNVTVNRSVLNSESKLRELMKYHEKPLILNSLFTIANEFTNNGLNRLLRKSTPRYSPFYKGKVRSLTDIGYNLLLLNASNRISAFDRHLTEVPDKGRLLNEMSAWWFNKTRHIIDNHYLFSNGSMMVARKCKPIMLEIGN